MEENRPKPKRTAKDVIADTTKEGQDRIVQDLSEDEDDGTPLPQAGVQGQVKIEADVDVDEIQKEVAVAEARDEGVINDPPEAEADIDEKPDSPTPKATAAEEISDNEEMETEEIVPPKRRSIKLRVNGSAPVSDSATNRPVRGKKRKGSSPLQIKESSPEPKSRPKRKGRATKFTTASTPAPPPAPMRSLRSRAPKSQEQEQADRAARARIRAALSEDVDLDLDLDDQDEEEADLEL